MKPTASSNYSTILSKCLAVALFNFLATVLFSQSNIQQNLSINSTGAAAHSSAQLDVSATDKGMLVPRMTSAQRTAIASPATGLLVFDTTTGGFWFYNGSAWTSLSGGGGGASFIADADGNTKVQVEKNPNEDIIRFDLGGTENMVLRKNTGGVSRLELLNQGLSTFVGKDAGLSQTSGILSVAYGYKAYENTTTGSSNTAVGTYALRENTTGSDNTAVGTSALDENTTANGNTAVGTGCLNKNLTGDENTAVGAYSLADNTTGSDNTGFGRSTLQKNTTGGKNTAYGTYAMFYNTSGNGNAAHGYTSLYNNTTGNSNIAIGASALFRNTVRSNLVAVGDSSLFNNGLNATVSNQAIENTAVGSKALFANTTGFRNTAVGFNAIFENTVGELNTGVGYNALRNTTSNSNVGVGAFSLLQNTTGLNNIAIGRSAYFTSATLNNTSCIGALSGGVSNVNNRIEIGNTSVSWIGGQVNWGTYSDARIKTQVQENVPGLVFISKLRPVTYHLDIHKQNEMCFRGKKDIGEWEGMYDIEQKQMSGFIAQEVEAAAKAVGYDFSGVEKGADEVGLYSVRYAEFVVPLVKAVQEQQEIIGQLKNEVADLQEQNRELEALKAKMVELEAMLLHALKN